jgi:hypothetical protein
MWFSRIRSVFHKRRRTWFKPGGNHNQPQSAASKQASANTAHFLIVGWWWWIRAGLEVAMRLIVVECGSARSRVLSTCADEHGSSPEATTINHKQPPASRPQSKPPMSSWSCGGGGCEPAWRWPCVGSWLNVVQPDQECFPEVPTNMVQARRQPQSTTNSRQQAGPSQNHPCPHSGVVVVDAGRLGGGHSLDRG